MAKFSYRMQSILNIKQKMEVQAKQEFASAKIAYDQEEEKLLFLQNRKREYEEHASSLLLGALNVLEIAENTEAIMRMDEFIALQYLQVEKAANVVEAAREASTTVMKER